MGRGPWWRIAWRNLGRNPRRSILTAGALAVGYFASVVMVGWAEGLVAEMIGNGTSIITGQLQVHHRDYLPDRDVYATLGGEAGAVDSLLHVVAADPAVAAVAPRIYGGGLLSTGAATAAGLFLGVDPEREPQVSRILSTLVRGRTPRPDGKEVVIGVEMARTLSAEPGTEIVVVAPAVDGSLGNDLFTVAGVFETGLADLDRTFALMPIRSLQTLMALGPDRVHEIAAAVPDPWQASDAARRLDVLVASAGVAAAAESWADLRPELVEYATLTQSFEWVFLAIIFGMAIFGVANTMLMATFERRREFALLLALGTTPPNILRSVLYEALVLGALSIAAGALVTFPVLVWWHTAPPDMSWLFGNFTMAGALVRPVLRVEYPWAATVQAGVALVMTALLAALYPAIRSARIPPADTLTGR